MLALRALDARILGIGDRLSIANAGLCREQAPVSGLALHDLAQYGPGYRAAAAKAFALGEGPSVLAVDPSGPAARVGIRTDDAILAVNGATLGGGQPAPKASFDSVERDMDRLDAAFDDGAADLTLERAGERIAVRLQPERGCKGRFQLVPGGRMNAGADGRYIQISSALTLYAEDDDELAAILAHELAHNILNHRVRLDEAKVSRGLFESVGRNARLIRETEVEADRLSVYLLDRAGYSIDGAVRFWRRFGPEHGLGILASPTHPGWKSRVETIEEERAVLGRMKQSDPMPMPPMLARAGAPLK